MIYLDNAATTWPKPESVYNAVMHAMQECGGNPGRGGHSLALAASRIMFRCREGLADLLGVADSANIAFTANATAGLNIALQSLVKPGSRVVTTSFEHNAVARILRMLEIERKVELIKIGCDNQGRLDLESFSRALAQGVPLAVVCYASNVTGARTPFADIVELAKKYNTMLVVDAAQTVGVEAIDVGKWELACLAASGHKALYGPQGTGFLYVRPDISIVPQYYGGTGSESESDRQPEFMPDKLESGTPNLPGIAGLAAGIQFVQATGLSAIKKHELFLAERLLNAIKPIKGIHIYGPMTMRERTAIVSLNIDGYDCGNLARQLEDKWGIICRSGLHCAPWAHQTLGTTHKGAVRISPGWFNNVAEIDIVTSALISLSRGEK